MYSFEETLPEEFREFEQIFGELMNEDILASFLLIFGAIAMVAGIIALVCYIFRSIALYTMAKNRGIRNPWLAWLPVGGEWIAGSLSDQYRYVVHGQTTSRRIILLVLNLAPLAVSWLMNQIPAMAYMTVQGEPDFKAIGSILSAMELVISGLNVAAFVFWQIALYDIYTSCDPKNNVLFLVLGIIFGITVPFFLFFNRNKEQGMPARKPEPQPEEPQWQPQPPHEEPWEDNF